MKKAEDYLEEEVDKLHYSDQPYFDNGIYDGNSKAIISAIKAAQLDAIEATVKLCAENVAVECTEAVGVKGMYLFGINKQSILSVADKLKSEL